ncbi:thioredoxin [Pseudoduganella buxea]|uniref:Thioredoxin n=1 Tax=Pseudoduganella buxea TaxID=1949069 RepID=A0A6I3T4P2_9BURK|nr:thioredoxin [Pseudoduganella buxea]MTV56433.1 thioredoxin [Pseudoduganella buxea]GGC13573.1 hypothetical protein GCM10011572_38720 [Pseudoduganella buxea]
MSEQLDPWHDASRLAARLAGDDALLILAIGAEQWCARCRALRPAFDAIAAAAPDSETWLWLDIEDHTEFIGDYFPENLPVLLAYRGERVLLHRLIDDRAGPLDELLAAARAWPAADGSADPGIRRRLLVADWAPAPQR